jgi:hypothetical protein
MNKLMTDTKSLYVVFALTVLNLAYFIMNRDSESLLLFVVISYVCFSFNQNMIYVLLFPLVIINSLILFRRLMNPVSTSEGFTTIDEVDFDEMEKASIVDWVKQNMNKDKYIEYVVFKEAIIVDDEMDDDELSKMSLKQIIDRIKKIDLDEVANENDKQEDETANTPFAPVDQLIKYIRYVYKMDESDASQNEEEVKFAKMMTKNMVKDIDVSSDTKSSKMSESEMDALIQKMQSKGLVKSEDDEE